MRELLRVATGLRGQANAACAGDGLGPDTFSVGLAVSDRGAPSHWLCCTVFGAETRGVLDRAGIPYVLVRDVRGPRLDQVVGEGKRPEQALADWGLTRVIADGR